MAKLSKEAIEERRRQLIAEEELLPLGWWWLSFCDSNKPEGQQFLGCAIVRARGFIGAVEEARAKGCNPGGQALGAPLPDGLKFDGWANRLLTREECEEFDQVNSS
jgi:hypothetical protein